MLRRYDFYLEETIHIELVIVSDVLENLCSLLYYCNCISNLPTTTMSIEIFLLFYRRSSQQIYNVTLFFLFFMSLYSLLGVQFFGELTHHCVRNSTEPGCVPIIYLTNSLLHGFLIDCITLARCK